MTEAFSLNQLSAKIVGWANDRCLNERRYVVNQFVKLAEELGELNDGFVAEDVDMKVDATGDVYVVATIMCAQLGSSITVARMIDTARPLKETDNAMGILGNIASHVARNREKELLSELGTLVNYLDEMCHDYVDERGLVHCVNHSWNVIKDRKGRMVDGVFIKEGE